MPSFADMLSYLRKRSGLSQKDLAEKIGVSRSAIGMYETGEREPAFETLEAFADTFNVNMDTLLGKAGAITATESVPALTENESPFYQQAREIFKGIPTEEQEGLYQALLWWNNIFASYQTPGDLGSKKITAAAFATGLIKNIDQTKNAEIIDLLSQILMYLKTCVREGDAQALKHLLEKKTPTAEETTAAYELFQAYCKAEAPIREIVDTALKPYRQEESFTEEIG